MWLWTALLLWVPGSRQTDSTKAVITLHPPWVNAFPGENINLCCEGPGQPGDNSTRWFHNGSAIQTLTPRYSLIAASIKDSGVYRCQTALSMPSDLVQLEIHRGWLLLQVSSRVLTEGEPLALRCHAWKNKVVYNMVFYQNGKSFQYSPRNSELTILKTNLSHNGTYHCSGKGRREYIYTSAEVSVTVKELFPVPVLRASLSSPLLEGNPVNLSCETKLLLPQRLPSQLYFSFYMDSKILKDRNTSSEYRILSAKREYSGLYWCEAATEDGKVLKRSSELELQVLDSLFVLVCGCSVLPCVCLQPPALFWFHVFVCLTVGILFFVDTILCVTIQKELPQNKKRNSCISWAFGCEKKATSYLQKAQSLEEELKFQE